jgi:DNA polymerase-3 subunit epsilon
VGLKPLFLDCQTTGLTPSLGHLLELAWESELGEREFLLRLPEESKIPRKVTEITGIRLEDLSGAVEPVEAIAVLLGDLKELGSGAAIVAHYARFEKSFLEPFGLRALPWLCTYQLARRLVPEAPSRNIRALAGYFDLAPGDLRRAREHVHTTKKIWKKLSPNLPALEPAAIEKWLGETKAPKAKTEFRVDRLKRLGLPDRPGIYRMLAKDGRVLYVGKATSLRDRVNSYFRGKGPGARKREMLARVCEIQTTECGSALEAALLENEEIKRLDPPYNVSLKAGDRQLKFFSRDFSTVSTEQDAGHPLGPYGKHNAFEVISEWLRGAALGESAQIFHDEVEPATLREGERIFLSRNGLKSLPPARSLLALGLSLARKLVPEEEELLEAEEDNAETGEDENAETPLTPEEAADRYEHLVLRAAWEYRRAKAMTRLLDCRVHLGERELELRGGALGGKRISPRESPWLGLGVADYDRLSVLLTEVTRHGYPVESLRSAW